MKILEFCQESDLESLRPEWERILRQSDADTIFLTYEWVKAWWTSYGKPGELRILAAVGEDGVMRGIALLRVQTLRRSGQKVPALIFIGDGTTDSDYLDFVVERGFEAPVLEAFYKHCLQEQREISTMALNEIPETSPNLPLLKTLAERDGMLWTESNVPCGAVRLPATWGEYLGMLRPRFRTHIRSVLRNFENREEVKFGFCEDEQLLGRLLESLFDLHSRRWAENGNVGVFSRENKRDFYHTLSPVLLHCSRLRFSWLEWNGRVLACQYGFIYNGTYSQLQEGYEPAAAHWNCGVGLRAWSIRRMIEEGLREYDFLGGIGRHKTDWGAQIKHSKRIVMARSNWKTFLFCRGGEWRDQAKQFWTKASPEKLSAAYTVTEMNPGANDWRRKAVADTYFNLGFPAVLRPLRERYQLAGTRLHRRAQPSARILYYHRVNNDRDPFFPAIPTSLFEQQIRHLARHYKVVGMPDLRKHLDHGPAENVVAITFDDGFRDNYQNAFPILERYGLVATIFLTTGTMDYDNPIWFERLALAVKKTSLELYDLEIDVPRRLFLRTEAERLDTNHRIFEVLRNLPDAERTQWLPRIVRQLGMADDGERRGKMLTWDEARFMSAHGIDFGGHTVTHPFLSRLTRENAFREVSECKRRIEDELQRPVECFAYPNGRAKDLGPWSDGVIRDAGYRTAVTTIWGLNYSSTDRMRLKRGGPWEKSQAMFACKLDWYQFADA